jgi:glycosyltransferase involved in cell wall biosynthesis
MTINKKTKIAIIGTNGLPGRYGGWDQLLNHLTSELRGQYSISVYTSYFDAVKGVRTFNGATLPIIPFRANGAQSVIYDVISMIHAIFARADIFLILGTSGCIFMPVLKYLKIKTILNPDGAEWKRGKWNYWIKKFLSYSEYLGVKYATSVVADNKVIRDTLKNFYSVESHLIEYGGDNARRVPLTNSAILKYGIVQGKYAFKVCRIVPENNIDLILEAFSKFNFKLIIIGNWNFSEYGIKLRTKYSSFGNLLLLDPIYEQETLDELRSNCGIYIHGHSVGGTNPSLVEAMSLSLFCLVYDVDYNRETTENKALYFSSESDLINQLELVLSGQIDVNHFRAELFDVAQRRYKWSSIISKYNVVFQSLIRNNS